MFKINRRKELKWKSTFRRKYDVVAQLIRKAIFAEMEERITLYGKISSEEKLMR